MKQRVRIIALFAVMVGLMGQSSLPKYAVGQIWDFKTRSQDKGVLVKIQQIENFRGNMIYHVNVSGVRFSTKGASGDLPHLPVSQETLDNSVTALTPRSTNFPSLPWQAGVTEWNKAEGGVFTLPLADIVQILDDQTKRMTADRPAG